MTPNRPLLLPPLLLALGLVLARPAPAQREDAPAGPFPELRAAMTASFSGTVLVIAFRGREEPVILGKAATPDDPAPDAQTLMPLGALVRVLVADALHARHKGDLTVGSGVRAGERELPLGDLLGGSLLLPDYFAWDASPPVDRATLLRCVEAAAGVEASYRGAAQGLAELVLLEPFAFGPAFRDWPTMLRATLGPHVPGLDPLDGRTLGPAERPRLLPFADGGSEGTARTLAQAEPAPLRLVLSAKNVAAWWQWRALHGTPNWHGARMGRTSKVPQHRGHDRWWFIADSVHFSLQCYQYPAAEAGILLFTSNRSQRLVQPLQAFENDLFGGRDAPDAQPQVGQLAQGALAFQAGPAGPAAAAPPNAPKQPLVATQWRGPAGADGAPPWRLHIENLGRTGIKLVVDGAERASTAVTYRSGGFEVTFGRTADGVTGRLLLWPQPDLSAPKSIVAVLVDDRTRQVSLPRVVELVPDEVK